MPKRPWSGSLRRTWEIWRHKRERVLRDPLASAGFIEFRSCPFRVAGCFHPLRSGKPPGKPEASARLKTQVCR